MKCCCCFQTRSQTINRREKGFAQHQQQNPEFWQLLSNAGLSTTLSLHRAKPSGSAVPAREQGIVGKRGIDRAHVHCYGPQWSSGGMKALQKFDGFHFPTAQAMALSQERDSDSQCSPPKTKRGKRDRAQDAVKMRTSWVLALFHPFINEVAWKQHFSTVWLEMESTPVTSSLIIGNKLYCECSMVGFNFILLDVRIQTIFWVQLHFLHCYSFL